MGKSSHNESNADSFPFDLEQVLLEAKRNIFKESFYEFFKWAWKIIESEDLHDNFHIKFLCDAAQEVAIRQLRHNDKEGKRHNRRDKKHDLAVAVSPSETKSRIFSVMLPAWCFAIDPSVRIITASGDIGLASYLATESRKLIESDEYRALFPESEIRAGENAKAFYQFKKGGFRLSFGTGSNKVGMHADLHIYDDLVKTKVLQGTSLVMPSEVSKANTFWTKVVNTRFVRQGRQPIIMVMQRVAPNDPIGTLIKMAKKAKVVTDKDGIKKKVSARPVKLISLPAMDKLVDSNGKVLVKFDIVPKALEEHYTEGTYRGHPVKYMNPERNNESKIMSMEDLSGQYMVTLQMGQKGKKPEGNLIKGAWLPIISPHQLPPAFYDSKKFAVMDTATGKETGDPTGVAVVRRKDNILYIVDWFKNNKGIHDAIVSVNNFLGKHGIGNGSGDLVFIENKSTGNDFVNMLRSSYGLSTFALDIPSISKTMRVQTNIGFISAKQVRLIKGEWNEEFLEVCTSFPQVPHDEEVDCLVLAIMAGLKDGGMLDGGGYIAVG